MPELDSPMHLRMLRGARRAGEIKRDGLYGLHWGDPQSLPALRHVRDHFLLPYVNPDHTAVEIGPGGGRWTRYMLGFGLLYAVDYHKALLRELAKNFRAPQLRLVRNNGADFPGIEDATVDFVFAFGVFVHLDAELIASYLQNMRRILKPSATVVIQYADKNKEEARAHGKDFADTTPETIRSLVTSSGYSIAEEDTTTLWHSSVVRFGPC